MVASPVISNARSAPSGASLNTIGSSAAVFAVYVVFELAVVKVNSIVPEVISEIVTVSSSDSVSSVPVAESSVAAALSSGVVAVVFERAFPAYLSISIVKSLQCHRKHRQSAD